MKAVRSITAKAINFFMNSQMSVADRIQNEGRFTGFSEHNSIYGLFLKTVVAEEPTERRSPPPGHMGRENYFIWDLEMRHCVKFQRLWDDLKIQTQCPCVCRFVKPWMHRQGVHAPSAIAQDTTEDTTNTKRNFATALAKSLHDLCFWRIVAHCQLRGIAIGVIIKTFFVRSFHHEHKCRHGNLISRYHQPRRCNK